MPVNAPGVQLREARIVPKPLEIEVNKRFLRWDVKYAEEQKKRYPHLVKSALEPKKTAVGAPGKGSVIWVGLNPDPCKAKYLEKCGSAPSLRPTSAPAGGRPPRPATPFANDETMLQAARAAGKVAVPCDEDSCYILIPGSPSDDGFELPNMEMSRDVNRSSVPPLRFPPMDSASEAQSRSQRPSSAPPRSRQSQARHCANILQKEGSSALEQAVLLRELRAGHGENTPPGLSGSHGGKPRKGAWLSQKFEQHRDLPTSAPASQAWGNGDEPPGGAISGSLPNLLDGVAGQSVRPSSAKSRPPSAGKRPASAGLRPRGTRQPFKEIDFNSMSCNEHYIAEKMGISNLAPAIAAKASVPLGKVDDPLELLYYGFSHEDGGRKAYLKERSKLPTQQRYKQSMTAMQDVGWLIGDPRNGRRPPIQKPCYPVPSNGVIC